MGLPVLGLSVGVDDFTLFCASVSAEEIGPTRAARLAALAALGPATAAMAA